MTPVLFATWERFSREDFVRVRKLMSVISFRYTVVSGLNPNALEPAYHEAAKAVLDKRATNLATLFEGLEPIYVNDGKFRNDFALLSVDTGGQRKKLVKYILARLEEDASGRSCDPDTDPATIEHVLPENARRLGTALSSREMGSGGLSARQSDIARIGREPPSRQRDLCREARGVQPKRLCLNAKDPGDRA
jgi:hypothetical protein